MTFTYNGDGATNLDLLRLRVGDVTSGSGPRPDGGNFTDEELTALLSNEGSVPRAMAAVYEALASQWGTYVNLTVGPRREELSAVAEQYRELAAQQRDAVGYGSSARRAMQSRSLTRIDGYSDDKPAGEAG